LAQKSERIAASVELSDRLVDEASKREIIAVARVLALHVAHYRSRYGNIPLQDSMLIMLTASAHETLADGVQVLIDALRAVAMPAGPTSTAPATYFSTGGVSKE
jgi:hypothetical protein